MAAIGVTSRISRSVFTKCRSSLVLVGRRQTPPTVPVIFNQFHSLIDTENKVTAAQSSLLRNSFCSLSTFPSFGFSSSASRQSDEKKENVQSKNGPEGTIENSDSGAETVGDAKVPGGKVPNEKVGSDSDSEGELTIDDLTKLLTEKEEQLDLKQKEIESMKDKVLRTYAEMENVVQRTKREAENSKKFAIQSFAKGLLDVADNLGRASSVVKESFGKIDAAADTAGAVPLLKTLLEGVEMTDKQLAEVFKKFGVEKFDPTNEPFDPNRHNAVFQAPDPSKPPGTVVVVLKPGYVLHDRILRPAEVGVTAAADNEAEASS